MKINNKIEILSIGFVRIPDFPQYLLLFGIFNIPTIYYPELLEIAKIQISITLKLENSHYSQFLLG